MGLQSLPLQLIKHLANTTSVASSPAGPVGCYPLLDNTSPIEPTVTNWDLSVTLILTELFQHNLINVSYLTACYLYQVMMTLHFLNDVANDAESTQK